ncbi:Hypothetical_protein [Hexamita inflata]|uniref:Hypothetical_protein n=1 Tax=Hexamita inflata TaxID=28002 RepID=A0AA86PTA2_9EUKA|nr:Hypothetical protein HINF_LOCUS33575 [Hexamita inflata]
MQQVSQFAVFGFNTQSQDVIDSDIFVTINYSILTGALICLQCNIDIQTSHLQFVAHGIQISAIILKSINIIKLSEVHISFRFQSNLSSGIVNQVNQSITTFSISQSIITGFNYLTSASNGYMCSKLFGDIQVEIFSLYVCVDNTQQFGSSSFTATLTQRETLLCTDICKANNYVTYGLCLKQPEFSQLLQNSTVICEYPFVFNSHMNSCECDFGFFLNVSYCVNVINQFSITQKNATNLESEFRKTEIELKTAFIGLEQLILSNISELTENNQIINNNILNINQTINKNINEMRTENVNQFNVMTANNEIIHLQATEDLNNVRIILLNSLDTQTTLINENQLNMKNNFTAQKDQITDFRTNISSIMNLVDQRIVNTSNDHKADLISLNTTLKNKLDVQFMLISDNQLSIKNNFTAQKDYVSDFRANLTSILNLVDQHITNISNDHKVDLTNVNQTLNTKLDAQSTLINNNQLFIKNNFTAQKDQISDFIANVTSTFNVVETHIASFQNSNNIDLTNVNTTLKNRIDAQTALITDNQLSIKNNFTAQKDQIQNLKIAIETRFTSLDSQVQTANSKLDDMKVQISGAQTSIETKINTVSTQMNTFATQTQVSELSSIVATQSYLKDVYESLVSAVNGIVAAQDPCKQWPGSVNQGGICKCEFYPITNNKISPRSFFCPNWNSCCYFESFDSINFIAYYKCQGMETMHEQLYVNPTSTDCPGSRQYTNYIQ